MKRLRNFCSQKSEGNSNNEEVDRVMNTYGGMNETELMEELIKKVRQQKENGTYDAAQMNNFANMISARLTSEQRKRLNEILSAINED